MLAVPPLAFVRTDESEAVLILHMGRSLCGHDGIVHGGMIATVFDEALGRNVSSGSINNSGPKTNALIIGSAEHTIQHRSDRNTQYAVQEANQGGSSEHTTAPYRSRA